MLLLVIHIITSKVSTVITSATEGGRRLRFHPFVCFVCLPVSRISQKDVDGFGRILVDRLGGDEEKLIGFW